MTMKTKKTLQHIAAVAVVLLTLCLVLAAPVSAEGPTENSVAYIVSGEEITYYNSLEIAVNVVTEDTENTETTIYLYDADGDRIVTGTGLQIPDGTTGKSIIFDFNGLTYNVTSCVSSSTTLTQGAHFSSGNIVTLKNGTLAISPEADHTASYYTYILVQNYADLTLEGMTLDGTNLEGPASGKTYVLSNCMGEVTIQDTTIIAKDGSVAFDVDGAYSGNGGNEVTDKSLSVTILGDSNIQGAIEVTEAASGRTANLIVNGGSFTDPTILNYLDVVEEKEADVTVTLADAIVTVAKPITISSGKATLDLNGKRLQASDAVLAYLFTINGENAQLIVTDSSEIIGVIETLNGKAVHPMHGIFDFQRGLITDNLEESSASVTIYVEGSMIESSDDYTVVNIGEFASVDAHNYALAVMGSDCSVVAGVNVTISGELKSAAGVCILGSINRDLDEGTYSLKEGVNYPEITVTNTANITSIGSPAIYAAGYGIWTIEDGAELTGNEALSIKTGNFTINGGTFTANGENTVPPNGYDNGPEETGAALSITSNDDYPGDTKVNILGGTFTSQKGYAVYEGLDETESDDSHVKLFSLQGGNFITNNASLSSPVLFAKMANKQVITGGWFNKVPTLAYLPSGYLPVAKDGGVEVSLSEIAVTVVNAESGAIEGTYTKAPAETFSVSEITAEEGFDFKLYTDSACTTEYMDGMPVYQSMTLYIKWIPHIYYIEFNGNAAEGETLVGTMAKPAYEYGKEYQLSALNFSIEGKVFAGWAESADGPVVYQGLAKFSNLSVENASTVTLFAIWEEVADIEPEEFVDITIDENGVSTVTKTTDDAMILDNKDKTVTLTNSTSNVQIVILFDEDDELEISGGNSVSGNVTNVTVIYPGKFAEIPNFGTVEQQVKFVLSNVTSVLPVINATYNYTVADAIHENIADEGGVVFAMITAENADAVNDNMTDNGVTVTFTIEKAKWTSLMGGEELTISEMQLMISEELLKGIHLSNGEVKELTPSVSENGDNWVITLTGTGFSSYALAFYELEEEQGGGTTTPDTNSGSNTDDSSGSIVKPDTPTEVPPTEEPTDDPTDVPGTDLPETPETPEQPEEPASPAPVLAVLAALGAAVVLRRK